MHEWSGYMTVDLNPEELAFVVQALELKVASLERARKNLTGSLQLAYAHEATQASACLVKLKGLSNEEKARKPR